MEVNNSPDWYNPLALCWNFGVHSRQKVARDDDGQASHPWFCSVLDAKHGFISHPLESNHTP